MPCPLLPTAPSFPSTKDWVIKRRHGPVSVLFTCAKHVSISDFMKRWRLAASFTDTPLLFVDLMLPVTQCSLFKCYQHTPLLALYNLAVLHRASDTTWFKAQTRRGHMGRNLFTCCWDLKATQWWYLQIIFDSTSYRDPSSCHMYRPLVVNEYN